MSTLDQEITALDNYDLLSVPDVIDLALDSEVDFSTPAQNGFLSSLKIPASYWKNATEHLQKSMLVESAADKKEVTLRVAREDDGAVIGIFSDIAHSITMSSVSQRFGGDNVFTKGSLIHEGVAYMFKQLGEISLDNKPAMVGYNLMFPSMFSKEMSVKPSIMVLICTNGMVDEKRSGKEFRISPNLVATDYVKMVQDGILGVVSDSKADYQDLMIKANGTEVVDARQTSEQVFNKGTISKTLYLKSLKIIEILNSDEVPDDPAHPKSADNVWDFVQMLSYTARSFTSPTSRASAETSVMNVLYDLAA